jgi:hypothetical protein
MGVLSERKYPLGVRDWRILIPVLCAIWCCEEWLYSVSIARSIAWVSVSNLYSRSWASVAILGPILISLVLVRCRSVLPRLS